MTNIKKRTTYFDVLNIMACISVIALHHNGIVHSFSISSAWRQSLLIECVCYWAVPVFMMISGANLLDYRNKYDTKTFFAKRITRTVIPWICWSCFLLCWKLGTGQLTLENPSVVYILDLIVNNKVENVYWFFSALFSCYLAMPIISLLINKREILWYIVGINFVFISCMPMLELMFNFNWNLSVPVTGSLIIFVVLGYLLSTQEISLKWRITIYGLGIFSLVFRYVYTLIKSYANNSTDISIKGYSQFHSVFLAVAVFVFIKQIKWDCFLSASYIKVLSVMSSCSFGVYLIHRMVMYYELKFLALSPQRLLWRIPCIFVTYGISLCIILVLKKVPLIRKVVG